MTNIDLLRKMRIKVGQKIYASISEDGGAAGVDGVAADPMTTAEMLFCLSNSNLYYPSNMVKWLERAQDKNGKWTTYKEDAWEVSITSWAILALASTGNTNSKSVLSAVEWLLAQQGADGGFYQSDTQLNENTYATSYACLALYSIDALKFEEKIKAGITWLKEVQNVDGGFGLRPLETSEASLTAYVAHFIGKIDNTYYDVENMKKKMIDYLLGAQKLTGAWTSWFELDDSIEGTCFTLFSLYGLSYKNVTVYENACRFINQNLNLQMLDNWIAVSLLYLIIALEKMVGDSPL